MICPACGHKNTNESAPFCAGCGRPVGVAAVSHDAPKSSVRMVVPSALLACLAIAGGGLFIWHRSDNPTRVASAPSSPAKASSVPILPGASDAATPGAPAPGVEAAPEPPLGSVTTVVPAGANVAALAAGGEIESVTNAYGPGHFGRLLLDDSPATVWTPEGDVVYPQEIVFSFYKRDTALVSALVLVPAPDG